MPQSDVLACISAAGHRFDHDPALLIETADCYLRAGPQVVAELCETSVQVSVSEAPPLFDLDLSQFGAYRFDQQSSRFAVLRAAQTPELGREALLGPLLLHALAHRRVFVMHASALQRVDAAAVLFTANSGVGKSTLARTAQTSGWRRIADDLLPISASDGKAWVLPHLQQPKLAAEDQYPVDAPGALPLVGFVEIRRGAAPGLKRLGATATLERVLRNTVATRVFSRNSLRAHLEFCRQIASAVAQGDLLAAELTIADRPEDIPGAVSEALGLLESALA